MQDIINTKLLVISAQSLLTTQPQKLYFHRCDYRKKLVLLKKHSTLYDRQTYKSMHHNRAAKKITILLRPCFTRQACIQYIKKHQVVKLPTYFYTLSIQKLTLLPLHKVYIKLDLILYGKHYLHHSKLSFAVVKFGSGINLFGVGF